MLSQQEYEIMISLREDKRGAVAYDLAIKEWPQDAVDRLIAKGAIRSSQRILQKGFEYFTANYLSVSPRGYDEIALFEQAQMERKQRDKERNDAKRKWTISIVFSAVALLISLIANADKVSAFFVALAGMVGGLFH